jgi:hypothetical protein
MLIGRFKFAKALLILTVFFLVASCSNSDLPDYFKLGSLRVLTIKATPSEVNPTSGPVNVTITPLVTDLAGAGRALHYQLETCLDPGVSVGATPNCGADPAKTTQSGDLTLSAPKFTEAVAALTVSVPQSVFSNRSAIERFNGVAYLVTYQVTTDSGEVSKSFKRIIATERTPVNVAPTISALQLSDGTAVTSLPKTESTIIPILNGSAESYNVKLSDGSLDTRTENLTTSWFVSDGSMKYSRTVGGNLNQYTPPESTTLPLFMVIVVRDNRGGTDFFMVGP